jgi:hypothetical protein
VPVSKRRQQRKDSDYRRIAGDSSKRINEMDCDANRHISAAKITNVMVGQKKEELDTQQKTLKKVY